MKTDTSLSLLAVAITELTSGGYMPEAIKLLRSIELDAWREARELVDKTECWEFSVESERCPNPALAAMDRVIQQLQLK